MDCDNSSGSDIEYEEDESDNVYNEKEKDYSQKTVEFPYEILSADDVVKLMNDTIECVTSIVEISTTTARVLLNYTKWNKELLMERLYGDHQSKLYEEAKIVPSHQEVVKMEKCAIEGERECEICCIEVLSSSFTGLACAHTFCFTCWNQYLEVQILDEGRSDTISCPKDHCSILLDQETCLTVLQNERARQLYMKLITNNFVKYNPVLKWCPNQECNYAVQAEYVLMRPVTCRCNTTFCFNCVHNWHSPLKCDRLQKWLIKCVDDSETAHWMTVNTKYCPKCRYSIEKNGGCNHMFCKNCSHEFCWICERNWKEHTTHDLKCIQFNGDDGKLKEQKRLRAKDALARYLFYYNRYQMHQESLKLEQQLISNVRKKIQQLHSSGVSVTQTPFLENSISVLNRCRRTLMYTYPFAFYLQDNNDSHIFIANQNDLQCATEALSGYLENGINEKSIDSLKLKVLNLRQYCIDRCNALENHVEEGYDKDFWQYIEYD